MTEFETLTLWYQIIDLANSSLTNFLTVLLAMLAVSHFASDKIDRLAAGALLLLFTVFSVGMIVEIYSAYRDFADLAIEIQTLSTDPNSNISWHALGRGASPPTSTPIVVAFMCTGAYLVTVAYFIATRRKRNNGVPNDI